MKLFIVIYFIHQIVATVGPLPYGIDECQSHVEQQKLNIDKTFSDSKQLSKIPSYKGLKLQRKDVEIQCEYHDVRPELS